MAAWHQHCEMCSVKTCTLICTFHHKNHLLLCFLTEKKAFFKHKRSHSLNATYVHDTFPHVVPPFKSLHITTHYIKTCMYASR